MVLSHGAVWPYPYCDSLELSLGPSVCVCVYSISTCSYITVYYSCHDSLCRVLWQHRCGSSCNVCWTPCALIQLWPSQRFVLLSVKRSKGSSVWHNGCACVRACIALRSVVLRLNITPTTTCVLAYCLLAWCM